MKGVLCGFLLAVCAGLSAGCGGSTPVARLHAGLAEPPAWVTTIVTAQVRRFHGRRVQGGPHEFSRAGHDRDVVRLFGSFGGRATSLRLVISARTHRLLSAGVSKRIAPTQAPAIARRSNGVFAIFPPAPGHAACSIPHGGPLPLGAHGLAGECTTEFVTSAPFPHDAIRVRFGERWHMGGHLSTAAWIVTVGLRNGHVRRTQVLGQPPQYWK